MAQWRIQYMPKEVHILSGPSTLQPVTIALSHNDHGIIKQYTPREKDQDLPQLLSTLEAQDTHKEFCFLTEPWENKMDPNSLTKQTLV